MVRTAVLVLVFAASALPAAALAREPSLTMREAHALVARDLDRHFRTVVRVQVWGCQRRSERAIRCYTEFHRHKPSAVCVAHYDVVERRGGVVLAFRALEPLFGSPCRRASGGIKPHYHLLHPR